MLRTEFTSAGTLTTLPWIDNCPPLGSSHNIICMYGLFRSGLTLNPRLKINQIKFFLYTNVFHCFCFVCFSQQKDKHYTENLFAKLQKWNQTFAYPRLVLLLGLAKSIFNIRFCTRHYIHIAGMPRSSYKALPRWIQQVSVSTWPGWFCDRSKHWSWFECCWTASCGAGQGTVFCVMPIRLVQTMLHTCTRPS